jgi:flagellar hook assembly protein FlgD
VELDAVLQIYDIYGNIVRTIRKNLYMTGYRTEPLVWDATDDSGSKVRSGVYVYRLAGNLPDGGSIHATSKLIVVN